MSTNEDRLARQLNAANATLDVQRRELEKHRDQLDLVNRLTYKNEKLKEGIKRAFKDIKELRGIVAAEAASTATLNITNPRALIGERLVDVLEENDAYRIRCGDMLIGVLLMRRGYEVRLGKMTITYLDKEYYHGDDYTITISNGLDDLEYVCNDEQYIDYGSQVYKIKYPYIVGGISTKYMKDIDLADGYTLRFMCNSYKKGVIELRNPDGDIILSTVDNCVSLHLKDGVKLDGGNTRSHYVFS